MEKQQTDSRKKWNVKHIIRKKSFRITAVSAVVLAGLLAVTLVLKGKASSENVVEMTIQSATARKGNISTTVVGTGNIASAEATDVKVPVGIQVEKVLVEKGDTVTKGQKLATVNKASAAGLLLEVKEKMEDVEDQIDALSDDADDEDSDEYLKKLVLQEELSELKSEKKILKSMMKNGVITAACAGTVESVHVSAQTKTSQSSSSESTEGTESSSQKSGEASQMSTKGQSDSGIVLLNSTTPSYTEIAECKSLKITAPVKGGVPQAAVAETQQYTGTISWNCPDKTFQAGTEYSATVILTAKDGYAFTEDTLAEIDGATITAHETIGTGEKNKLRIVAKFSKTAEETQSSTGVKKTEENTDSSTEKESNAAADKETTGQSSVMSRENAVSSAGSSVSTSAQSGDTSSTGTDIDYFMSGFEIASGNQMKVSISVDELDILSVKEGQTANITLDALDGQEFEGSITNVGAASDSGSSSVKYTVDITVEKAEDMLSGMSASATIQIDEANDAVLIPVSALQETGDSTFVYTKKDSKGNLSGEKTVETGLSDGSNVAIISGLREGDTVYYQKAESAEGSEQTVSDGKFEIQQGGMPGGTMPEGTMPDRGERPEGIKEPSGKSGE